jgi:predicted extracellular nuclease
MPVSNIFRRHPLALSVLAALNFASTAHAVSPNIVISQVYGGGGNTGATYRNDFIELFNRGNTPVSLDGMSVQYASSTGNSWSRTNLTNVTLQPGQYYLVQEAQGTGGTTNLPTPDATGTITMSGTNGKVALVNTQTTIGAVSCPNAANGVVDFVGYGSANCSEASPTAALANTTAALRSSNGCTDTDNNASDFASGAPNPRNTAAALAACGATLPTVNLSVSANTASEAGTTAITVTATASAAVSGDQTVSLAVSGTGITAGDYSLSNATITIPGGSTTSSVTFTVVDDAAAEGTETAILTLSNPSAGISLGATTSQNIVIADNDSVACGASDTAIGLVQGSGTASPLSGQAVTVQGVVVGDYEYPGTGTNADYLRGFYLQNTTGNADGDPGTSDGIFIFNGDNDSVSLGQVVQVTGTVSEYGFGSAGGTQTQITPASGGIEDCGTVAAIDPTDINLPFATAAEPERYEGMWVRLPQTLYVGEHFQLGRFGQVLLSSGHRLEQPTSVATPGTAANTVQASNSLNLIYLDDALQSQNPDPIQFGRGGNPLSASNTLRGGDTVTGLEGVMTQTDATPAANVTSATDPVRYRVRPINDLGDVLDASLPNFQVGNPRPATAPAVGGRIKVVGFNVLSYFLTLDIGTTAACGPTGFKQECRGAETIDELDRQRQKLLAALLQLDADIIGFSELENTQTSGVEVQVVQDIVNRLNALTAPGTYAYIDSGIIGTDTIRVGLVYKPGTVTPVGPHYSDSNSVHSRPPLAQLFEENTTSARFSVAVNHFKSKGSCPTSTADADQGDGQGCWNSKRTDQANATLDFIANTLVPNGGDPDVLVIGDLNAYAKEDPISAFEDAGYVNLVAQFGGAEAYSYVFDGQWGYLDHALASASLAGQVAGAADYHINADEPNVLDYNTNFKSAGQIAGLFAADEFRTSDHDPVVIGLNPARTVLSGGSAANVLTGGPGGDRLVGKGGKDTLTGGDGKDEFVYQSVTDGIDTITDFTVGSDKIVLTGVLQSLRISQANPIAAGYVVCAASGANSALSIDPDAAGPAAKRALAIVKGVGCGNLLQIGNFTF